MPRETTVVDPITVEVVSSRIREIAATMEHALYHSGYSTILRESKDGTAGLTDAGGRVVIVGGGLQYHSLPYERAVRGVLASYPPETLREGESFIANDPYLVGNPHVPDFVAVTPAFADGKLIGFGVSIAHKSDLGGLVPGSSSAGAREIYHEGLLIPPVRYRTPQGISDVVEAIIAANSRTPDVVLGDLRGQVGSTRIGAQRLTALCAEYGTGVVTAVFAEILNLTGRRLRREISVWPDGAAEAEALLDHDGVTLDRPIRIHVRVLKRGERLTLDFAGSAPQARGPVNANATTVESCALLAVLALIDPTIPMNSGVRDAVDVNLPPGLVVSPQHPAPMNNYVPTCQIAYSCVLSALGKINPVRAVAPAGFGGSSVAIGYRMARSGKPSVQYELMTTSLGGTRTGDGAQIVMGMTHVTPSTPIEVLESEFPIVVRAYDLWIDSAGPGQNRGGHGYVREYEFLDDCIFTVRGSNERFGAAGVDGGAGPKLSYTTLERGGSAAERIGILETHQLAAGAILRIAKCGGAGLGSPLERPVASVVADVRDGYVSLTGAAEDYGVVLEPVTLEVNVDATAVRRKELAERRGAKV